MVIFNFAFCVTVPSWLNEKAPAVSVNRCFWTSTLTATTLYTCVGILGALAFPRVPENMLDLLLSSAVGVTTRVCATIFGVVIIGFGIPIFCVIMRYNLVNGGLTTEAWAHVLSSWLPWACAWTLYQGNVILKLLSWSGLVLNGFIDFLMPGLVTLASLGIATRIRRRCCHPRRQASSGRSGADQADDDEQPPSLGATPLRPFPPWLAPYYVEIVVGMLALLLVLLPLASYLQLYCANSKACYPERGHR